MAGHDVHPDLVEDGYVVVAGAVDPELVAQVRRAVEPVFHGDRCGRLTNAWTALAPVRNLAGNPRLRALATAALGGDAVPFQTLNFAVGTEQRAHADTIHFDTVPSGGVCGLWVALEDVHDAQGPLVVYPASHRLPVMTPATLGLSPDHFDIGRYEDAMEQALEDAGCAPLAIHVSAGDAVMWAANLAHGGAAISRRGATRWSQVTHFVRRGSVLVTPMHSRVDRNEYQLRDPVVDVGTGRVVPIDREATGIEVVHRLARRSLVGVSGEATVDWRRRVESRMVRTARTARVRASHAAASVRTPAPT